MCVCGGEGAIAHRNSKFEGLKLARIHWLSSDSHFAEGCLRNGLETFGTTNGRKIKKLLELEALSSFL